MPKDEALKFINLQKVPAPLHVEKFNNKLLKCKIAMNEFQQDVKEFKEADIKFK